MRGFTQIKSCRIGGGINLIPILDLGVQSLTGVFPNQRGSSITQGPLRLVWCPESGLVQLAHSYDLDEMYGDNYGYRSGLNHSMVSHLTNKIIQLERFVDLKPGDAVLDIGSNDATSLKAYQTNSLVRTGIDPTGEKFKAHYPDDIKLIPDYFSAKAYLSSGGKPAKIVSSVAMFYDLEDPISFAQQVEMVLAPGGVWHLEQSYMPSMLRTTSYDTVCHEHLEYYSLGVVQTILNEAGLAAVDVKMNSINGGSFAITAARKSDERKRSNALIEWLLQQESEMGLNTPRPYRDFEERVFRHRQDLRNLINMLNAEGKKVLGYGASTKGNVLLQFCGFSAAELPAIAEVNPDKFGCFTPGTQIPIVSESDAKSMDPDYFLVLPWHFKESILNREREYLSNGGRMIFPFPEIEII